MQFIDEDFDPHELDCRELFANLGGDVIEDLETREWGIATGAFQAEGNGRTTPLLDTNAAPGTVTTEFQQSTHQATSTITTTSSTSINDPAQPSWLPIQQRPTSGMTTHAAIVSPTEIGRIITPATPRRFKAGAATTGAAADATTESSSSDLQSNNVKKDKEKSTNVRQKSLEPAVREYVGTYTNQDVLCQRGGMANRHPGNVKYLEIKRTMMEAYAQAPKSEKRVISKQLVAAIHNNGGRFLQFDYGLRQWYEITYKKACIKAGQTLRENYTPTQLLAKRIRSREKKKQTRLQLKALKAQTETIHPLGPPTQEAVAIVPRKKASL